jgi:hypothetical protein
MRKISNGITMHKNVFGGSSKRTSERNQLGTVLRETTRIESKRLSPTTLDLRDQHTGFPSAIFKQTTGSTNTPSMRIAPPVSLISMVFHMLIILVLVTTVQLFLAFTMLTLSSNIATIAALVVTAISALFILKTLLTLRASLGWLQDASKEKTKRGQARVTGSGGVEWL